MSRWKGLAARCAAITLLCSWTAAYADAIPVHDFAREPEFRSLKLSPDGRYVALIVPNEKHSALGVIRVADGTLIGSFRMDNDNHVEQFWWVNDDRLVAALATQLGRLDSPSLTGELVAMNADGTDFRYLVGYRGQRSQLGSRLAPRVSQEWAAAFMVDPLIDDHDNILISERSFQNWDKTKEIVYRMNVYTGAKTPLDAAPGPGHASFYADPQGQLRYARTWDGGLTAKTWQRLPGQKEWQPYIIPGIRAANEVVTPLGFSHDGASVYLASGEFGPRGCLVQHVLASGERRKLACDQDAGLDDVIYAFDGSRTPIAAVFAAGKPQTRLLEAAGPQGALLKLLMDAFPGKQVEPTSLTRDGKKALIRVYDDRTQGDYYLFDTETHKADFFTAIRHWIDPEQMSERRPIHLAARDGTPLWGYLTLPRGADPKQLPLVVNPHGGPFWVRDEWAFDLEPQLLASRGYAVLQVNFRGSGGYGSGFVEAGRKAWGTKMIDDITDAVRWTVAQGYADAHRICIYGGSYGGYAALMSAVREPELYRCVVGYAGVYDLKQFKHDSDITDDAAGRAYFADAIGGSDEEMAAQSPVTYLDRLKAPMLIVHGEEDRRVPFSQATALRKALTAGNHPFEWLSRPGEGHGFWKTANVEAFDEAMLAFLDRNIGANGAPAATAAQETPKGAPSAAGK